jgi:hypothetical protein
LTRKYTGIRLLSSSISEDFDLNGFKDRLIKEFKEASECFVLATAPLFQSDEAVTPEDIVRVCDEMDELNLDTTLFTSQSSQLRRISLEFKRYELLAKLMRRDYAGICVNSLVFGRPVGSLE